MALTAREFTLTAPKLGLTARQTPWTVRLGAKNRAGIGTGRTGIRVCRAIGVDNRAVAPGNRMRALDYCAGNRAGRGSGRARPFQPPRRRGAEVGFGIPEGRESKTGHAEFQHSRVPHWDSVSPRLGGCLPVGGGSSRAGAESSIGKPEVEGQGFAAASPRRSGTGNRRTPNRSSLPGLRCDFAAWLRLIHLPHPATRPRSMPAV